MTQTPAPQVFSAQLDQSQRDAVIAGLVDRIEFLSQQCLCQVDELHLAQLAIAQYMVQRHTPFLLPGGVEKQMTQALAAFHHFGGLTHEHLYDRPRTIGAMSGSGWHWNDTFMAFAKHWGFEPRVCRPYRAQTKGKVESGVKYFKRNFMPGRRFIDIADMQAQVDDWIATVADKRIHGTTHMRPIDRFELERQALLPLSGHSSFGECRRVARVVAEDYLVSYHTNRYSVPYGLIGKVVEVIPVGGHLHIEHNGRLVVEHPILAGRHQMRILPEHGPGPVARNARQRYASAPLSNHRWWGPEEVEVRDLAVYEGVLA